jgi:MFS family permease
LFLLFFETIPEEERTSVLTTFNLANAMAMVLGSVLGGSLLICLASRREAYQLLFTASFVGRLVSLIFLWRAHPAPLRAPPMAIRTLGVRPSEDSIDRPILSSLPAKPPHGD